MIIVKYIEQENSAKIEWNVEAPNSNYYQLSNYGLLNIAGLPANNISISIATNLIHSYRTTKFIKTDYFKHYLVIDVKSADYLFLFVQTVFIKNIIKQLVKKLKEEYTTKRIVTKQDCAYLNNL